MCVDFPQFLELINAHTAVLPNNSSAELQTLKRTKISVQCIMDNPRKSDTRWDGYDTCVGRQVSKNYTNKTGVVTIHAGETVFREF